MNKNSQNSQWHKPSADGADIDLTPVFRAAGLPQTVSASPAFEAKFALLARGKGTDYLDIIWAVRSAIAGYLPARSIHTSRGKALLLEFPSIQHGVCEEDVKIILHLTDRSHLCLMLPDEFHEASTLRFQRSANALAATKRRACKRDKPSED